MKPNIGQGDKGKCQLFGIGTVDKNHCLVELYGDLDELNSHLGHLGAHETAVLNFGAKIKDIQKDIFVIGSHVSTGGKQPEICADRIKWLEEWLEFLEGQLPELTSFLLPSGSGAASYAHVCRAVCRRVERKYVFTYMKEMNVEKDSTSLAYLNRLSDVLFAIARYLNMLCGREETLWSGSW